MHTDVNRHPHGCQMHQFVNLIFYLNPDWKDEYGGHLELWNHQRQPVRKIAPIANRVVLFNTGAGGKLNQILGDAVPVLDAASMLPFRTKGSMDDPETGADLELFGKTFVKSLRPDKLIEKGLGDLFKKK